MMANNSFSFTYFVNIIGRRKSSNFLLQGNNEFILQLQERARVLPQV